MTRVVPDGYYMRTIHHNVLVELSQYVENWPNGTKDEFESPQEAYQYVKTNPDIKEKVKWLELTVLPVIKLRWDDNDDVGA